MDLLVELWLYLFFALLFVLGCVVGSFLNVVVYRLPRGKNLGWPSSRCGACLTAIASSDNVPLLSYWKLGGRCRACGATFSMRYFAVELLTGVAFVLVYYLEIGVNVHGLPAWHGGGLWALRAGQFPVGSWGYFAGHAALVALLISATGILLDTGDLPLSLGVAGAIIGLWWAVLYPWPEPALPYARSNELVVGFMPWPAWPGVRAGLLTALVGLLLPQAVLRLVNAAHRRAVGRAVLGDAGPVLLLMTGGFLGWQPLVVALGVSLVLAHPLTRALGSARRGFPLALLIAVVAAWLGWSWLAPLARPWLFDVSTAPLVLAALTVALVALGVALRHPVTASALAVAGRTPPPPPA